MRPARTFRNLLAALGLALGLGVLAAGPLATGFLNDDYLFLEQARTRPLAGSLVQGDALGNYARPLSRQVYFAALTRISNGSPRVFHAVNFALFLGALALAATGGSSATMRSAASASAPRNSAKFTAWKTRGDPFEIRVSAAK